MIGKRKVLHRIEKRRADVPQRPLHQKVAHPSHDESKGGPHQRQRNKEHRQLPRIVKLMPGERLPQLIDDRAGDPGMAISRLMFTSSKPPL